MSGSILKLIQLILLAQSAFDLFISIISSFLRLFCDFFFFFFFSLCFAKSIWICLLILFWFCVVLFLSQNALSPFALPNVFGIFVPIFEPRTHLCTHRHAKPSRWSFSTLKTPKIAAAVAAAAAGFRFECRSKIEFVQSWFESRFINFNIGFSCSVRFHESLIWIECNRGMGSISNSVRFGSAADEMIQEIRCFPLSWIVSFYY